MQYKLDNFGAVVEAFGRGATVCIEDADGTKETLVLEDPLYVNYVLPHTRGGVIKCISETMGSGSEEMPFQMKLHTDQGDEFTATVLIEAPKTDENDASNGKPKSLWKRFLEW